jgi:hypothetical protein
VPVGGRLKLGQILVAKGLLHPDQLSAALAEQQATPGRLGATLVRMGFVEEEELIRALAGQLKLPVARIRGKRVSPEVLECVADELAEKHRCLPLFFKSEAGERVLYLAMEDPSDDEALAELERASGERLRAVLVAPTELEEAIQRHYHWASLTGEAPDWSAPRTPAAVPTADAGSPWPDDGPGDPDQADTAPELPDPAPDPDAELDLGLDLDEPVAPDAISLREPAARPPAESGSRPLRPDALDPRIILRALSQLLVEKGLIGRDELVQRLGEIAAREGGD